MRPTYRCGFVNEARNTAYPNQITVYCTPLGSYIQRELIHDCEALRIVNIRLIDTKMCAKLRYNTREIVQFEFVQKTRTATIQIEFSDKCIVFNVN